MAALSCPLTTRKRTTRKRPSREHPRRATRTPRATIVGPPTPASPRSERHWFRPVPPGTNLAAGSWSAEPLRDFAELLCLGEALQLLERLVLDLPHPLARDVEGPPDLVQGPRVLAAEPVAELEHAALAVGEVLEGLLQRLLGKQLGGALEGGLGALIGDELAELRLLLVADRLLEGDRGLGRALDRVDLLGLDAGDLGDLLRGGLAAQLGDQLALRAADLVELLDHVDGDADGPRLVGERTGDRLADPPGRV